MNCNKSTVNNYTNTVADKRASITNKLYSNAQFNNKLWRSILNEVVSKIDVNHIGLEVISPFGFEVTKNKLFLKSNLRRFYCYIGIPQKLHDCKESIYDEFDRELSHVLSKKFPEFYDEIVLKVIEEKFIKLKNDKYECKHYDKLIDIQCRYVSRSILDDYSDYLVCSLSAIYWGKDEPKEFLRNARFRNRTYQLYIILEELFGVYISKIKKNQIFLLNDARKKINNAIDVFFDDSRLYQPAASSDVTILNDLILPRTKEMMLHLNNTNDIVEIKCKSFHVNDQLSLTISKKAYDDAKSFILKSYINFY